MIRNFLRKFMIGRYGPDHLNIAMIIFSLALSLIHAFTGFTPLIYISYVVLALAFFRMLSRNITRRRRENDKFIRYWWPIRTKFVRLFSKLRDGKVYKYFKCPSCSNALRVPRGKGKLQITCPKCGERFLKKT